MYSLNDVLASFKICIDKNDINYNLVECMSQLLKRMENESLDITNIYAILDIIKYRKITLDKESIEYNILNEIKKMLKDYLNENIYSSDNSKSSSKYDIIDCLLQDENNYPLLKKIVTNYPDFINSKKRDKHIVNHILELYLYNLELLLTKQNKKILNIEYLKEIYSLFTKSSYIRMSKDDRNLINQKIYEFISKLTLDENQNKIISNNKELNTIYIKKDKKRKKLIEDIKKLSTHYYFMKDITNRNVDETKLQNQLNFIINSDYINRDREKEIDETNDHNIMLSNNDYISYSITNENDEIIVKVNMMDLTNVIPDNTIISNYIYNATISNTYLDERLKEKLKLKENSKQSVITFKISIKNNDITNFEIYKSKIIPNKIETDDNSYNNLLYISKKLSNDNKCDNDDIIYNTFKSIINEQYLKICNEYDLPFIYSGMEKIYEMDPNTYSDIAFILRKLDKSETKKLYNVIINNLGEFHYSNQIFEVIDNYDLNLIGNINYIVILNQIVIKTLLLNDLDLSGEELDRKRKEINRDHNDLLFDLNEALNHKDIEDFDIKTKSKKSKKIIYTISN